MASLMAVVMEIAIAMAIAMISPASPMRTEQRIKKLDVQ